MRRLLPVAFLWCLGNTVRAAEYHSVPAGDFGRRARAPVSAEWRNAAFDDRTWADAAPPDGGAGCAGTVYARWHFDTGPELPRLATLTLRARYEHGFVAYL